MNWGVLFWGLGVGKRRANRAFGVVSREREELARNVIALPSCENHGCCWTFFSPFSPRPTPVASCGLGLCLLSIPWFSVNSGTCPASLLPSLCSGMGVSAHTLCSLISASALTLLYPSIPCTGQSLSLHPSACQCPIRGHQFLQGFPPIFSLFLCLHLHPHSGLCSGMESFSAPPSLSPGSVKENPLGLGGMERMVPAKEKCLWYRKGLCFYIAVGSGHPAGDSITGKEGLSRLGVVLVAPIQSGLPVRVGPSCVPGMTS